jgi:hypothetical protein
MEEINEHVAPSKAAYTLDQVRIVQWQVVWITDVLDEYI